MKILIFGDGYAPLLSAIALKRHFPISCEIQVVATQKHSSRIMMVGSYFRDFHRWSGISEQEFARATKSDFQLATEIKTDNQARYFSESPTGFMLENRRFQHLFNYASSSNDRFEDFNLGVAMHKEGRFTPPSKNIKSLFSQLTYGYIFDSFSYFKFLGQLAEQLHITVSKDIGEDSNDYDLKIFTDSTPSSENPFTNARFSNLSENTVKVDQASSSGVSIQVAPQLTQAVQHSGKLQTRYFTLEQNSKDFGYRDASFRDKTIYLGGAYAKLPSILIDPSYLLQSQLMRLCKLPLITSSAAQAAIFNRNTKQEVEAVAEVDETIVFASKISASGTPSHRVQLFRESGFISQSDGECMGEGAWLSLLYALFDRPNAYSTTVEALHYQKTKEQLVRMKAGIANAAVKPPKYTEFINSLKGSQQL